MTSRELNRALRTLADREDLSPPVLIGTGKCLPYYGWHWRPVDFDRPVALAYCDGRQYGPNKEEVLRQGPVSFELSATDGFAAFERLRSYGLVGNRRGFVGFCEDNKWGYEQFPTDLKQTATIRRLCEDFATTPTRARALEVFDYLQSIRPASVTGRQRRSVRGPTPHS